MRTYRIKALLLTIALLSVSGVSGQRVITNHPSANGYPVIDLTELTPLGCVLTSKEASDRRTEINDQTPSNEGYLAIGSAVSGQFGSWNAKMSSQFQVMRENHPIRYVDWATAYTTCKNYDKEGGTIGQWRLPMLSEQIIIWTLHPQLLGKGGFSPIPDGNHWSGTETAGTIAWMSSWHLVFTNNQAKTILNIVRCIRDL